MEFDALNKHMTDLATKPLQSGTVPPAKPNDSAGLNIDEHVKIFDPNTKTVILEKRA